VPTGQRCFNLGRAIRKAVESYDQDINVHIWGTGGMSHQLQGARGPDQQGMGQPVPGPADREPPRSGADAAHRLRARSRLEGIELVMWLIARGAMSDVDGPAPLPKVAHRFYHVPASNTAVGHLILENQ
jgi:protocatechuate 4,5-dioxygenase beta chain